MNLPKFILKEDIMVLGDIVIEKGKIFTANEAGMYEIICMGQIGSGWSEPSKTLFTEDQMINNKIFEKIPEENFENIIEEVIEDDDEIIKNWRIQLDIKTTRKKLRSIEKLIKDFLSSN